MGNTKKPFTIVTEFREKKGELDGMYQYYYQDGKKIEFPDLGLGSGNSMTEDFCQKLVDKYGEASYFQDTGARGTCDPEDGDPKNLREKHPDAAFSVRHMRWGPIGSTHKSSEAITV